MGLFALILVGIVVGTVVFVKLTSVPEGDDHEKPAWDMDRPVSHDDHYETTADAGGA